MPLPPEVPDSWLEDGIGVHRPVLVSPEPPVPPPFPGGGTRSAHRRGGGGRRWSSKETQQGPTAAQVDELDDGDDRDSQVQAETAAEVGQQFRQLWKGRGKCRTC